MILYVNALGMRSGKLQQRSYIKKVKAQELFPLPRFKPRPPPGWRPLSSCGRAVCSSPALCARRKFRSTASRGRDGEEPCTPNVILPVKHATLNYVGFPAGC